MIQNFSNSDNRILNYIHPLIKSEFIDKDPRFVNISSENVRAIKYFLSNLLFLDFIVRTYLQESSIMVFFDRFIEDFKGNTVNKWHLSKYKRTK